MATIKNTRFVTDLEREVIKNIIHSEYMDNEKTYKINNMQTTIAAPARR